MKIPVLFIWRIGIQWYLYQFFSLCVVVLPVLFIFSGPVKSPIHMMCNCVACIIPWRIILLLSQDSWFQPLVFPEWSLVREKNNESNMMFWICISDNLPSVMVRMKCHHALVRWRMGDGWWSGRLQVVGWWTLQLCSTHVSSIVSHHLVCLTLLSCTFGSCVIW